MSSASETKPSANTDSTLGSGKSGKDAYVDTATKISDRHAARRNRGLDSAVRDALAREELVEGRMLHVASSDASVSSLA